MHIAQSMQIETKWKVNFLRLKNAHLKRHQFLYGNIKKRICSNKPISIISRLFLKKI